MAIAPVSANSVAVKNQTYENPEEPEEPEEPTT